MKQGMLTTSFDTRQAGATLITSLIILAILTILGLTVMNTAALEERMSGGWQDRKRAYQAAEMALRDAESFLKTNVTGNTGFAADCDNGLCYKPVGMADPVWKTNGLFDDDDKTIDYGENTGADEIEGVSDQPRYVIQAIPKSVPGEGDVFLYLITVRATGARAGTVVMLQEFYRL